MGAWLTAIAALLLGIFSFWLWQNLDQEEVAARLPVPLERD